MILAVRLLIDLINYGTGTYSHYTCIVPVRIDVCRSKLASISTSLHVEVM